MGQMAPDSGAACPQNGVSYFRKKWFGVFGGCNGGPRKMGHVPFLAILIWKKNMVEFNDVFSIVDCGCGWMVARVHHSSSSSSLESKVVHESSYVESFVFCSLAIPCAVENANSLQRANIIADFPFRPANELMTSILRVKSIFRSSSRMTSVAVDAEMGSMYSRSGSMTARHDGHVFFVLNEDSKHDVQNLCPHNVMDTFVFFTSSKHMGHLSASSSPWGATTFD